MFTELTQQIKKD